MSTPPRPGSAITIPLRFTQDDFDAFARLSGDDNPIHVDPAFAATTRFGRTVAHGMLLFATIGATIARWTGDAVLITGQDMVFPAPTFAGEDLELHLTTADPVDGADRFEQRVVRSDGAVTAEGVTIVGGPASEPEPPRHADGGPLGRLRVGRRASLERTVTPREVAELCELVDDPNPLLHGTGAVIPAPLLGGMVSKLLGVDLPGPGTNWLKQRYRFPALAPAGSSVRASVEITRIRAEKALVDLASRSETSETGVIADGRSLVLVRDAPSALG